MGRLEQGLTVLRRRKEEDYWTRLAYVFITGTGVCLVFALAGSRCIPHLIRAEGLKAVIFLVAPVIGAVGLYGFISRKTKQREHRQFFAPGRDSWPSLSIFQVTLRIRRSCVFALRVAMIGLTQSC